MTHKLLVGALALGSLLALSAVPAMAAPPPPSFSFGIHIGDGPDGGPPPPPPPHFDNYDDECLSTKSIFRRLSQQGYGRFEMVDHDEDGFIVDARKNFKWYELTVDDCDGSIIDRERITHR